MPPCGRLGGRVGGRSARRRRPRRRRARRALAARSAGLPRRSHEQAPDLVQPVLQPLDPLLQRDQLGGHADDLAARRQPEGPERLVGVLLHRPSSSGPWAARVWSRYRPRAWANPSVPIAWPRAFDQTSIHWSRNAFHCWANSGLTPPCAAAFCQMSIPWPRIGRQNWLKSGRRGGACGRGGLAQRAHPGLGAVLEGLLPDLERVLGRVLARSSRRPQYATLRHDPEALRRRPAPSTRAARPASPRPAASSGRRRTAPRSGRCGPRAARSRSCRVLPTWSISARTQPGGRDVVLLGPDHQERAANLAEVDRLPASRSVPWTRRLSW